MKKDIGILTMEIFESRRKDSVGSSRIRGTWLINHWPEAEYWHIARVYKAIVFQKAYFIRLMKSYNGIKILDMCDPDWLDKRPVKETIELCDAITCSSSALSEFVRGITNKPVVTIPDRVDLNSIQQIKTHKGIAETVLWYGYHQNFKVIDTALSTIKRMGLKLVVLADDPYSPRTAIEGITDEWFNENVTSLIYNQQTFNRDIIENADIVINPKLQDGRFKYKSNNKTVIAWAMGMPVAEDSDGLEQFMNEEGRIKEAEKRLKEVKEKWDIKFSVEQFKKLIDKINKQRNDTN